jgi:hypothetical protein
MSKTVFVLSLIIALICGLAIGYIIAAITTLNWCIEVGLHFLKLNGVSIGINEDLIKEGISKYRGNINQWLNISVQ